MLSVAAREKIVNLVDQLNPMENVWAYLRANKLAISVFDNYEQIVDRCCEAWNFFANDKTAITSITTRQWAEHFQVHVAQIAKGANFQFRDRMTAPHRRANRRQNMLVEPSLIRSGRSLK